MVLFKGLLLSCSDFLKTDGRLLAVIGFLAVVIGGYQQCHTKNAQALADEPS